MCNLDTKHIMNSIRTLVSNKKSAQMQEVFNDVKIVVAYKQPKNIKRLLTKTKFSDSETNTNKFILPGTFASCKDIRCNLCCNGYIQECSSFKAANGIIWNIKCNINCNSTTVLYYLKYKMCNGRVTYTGKTKTELRLRTNNHISCCRSGKGRNIFDNHVYECGTKNNCLKLLYFEVYAFMKVSTEEK